MRFEKWQALGNDYIIVERDNLPWSLTPQRVQRICELQFAPPSELSVRTLFLYDGKAFLEQRSG